MSGTKRLIRRRLPGAHAKIEAGRWCIDGRTGSGHIWLKHIKSGKRVIAPCSASDGRAQLNLVKLMDRIERGVV